MSDIGEGIDIAFECDDEDDEDQEETKKHIKIRVCVFFDGTLNNETNINQRLLCTPENKLKGDEINLSKELKSKISKEGLILAEKYYKKYGAKSEDDENSYEGFYTNIVKMKNNVSEYEGYDYTVKIYVEGAGSIDLEKDKTMGYAFALCKSGIKKKVKAGIEKTISQISKKVKTEDIIDVVTVDVFGFSRGAAQARNFIFEVLMGDKHDPIQKQLNDKGFVVNDVKVNFVGLYDTVSTYGLLVAFGAADNVKDLHLDSVRMAKNVVQLASADEHREYFSLTNINSASHGTEIFLPGAHSDIGGGYRDNINEDYDINWSFSEEYANKDCEWLIREGWYSKEQLIIDVELTNEGDQVQDVRVHANRNEIKNSYSLIPLHLMSDYAKENDLNINVELYINEMIPESLDSVKKEIDNYISIVGKKKSKISDWLLNNAGSINKMWVKDLRSKYCHFPAKIKIGHTPRMSIWSGERSRKIYNG